MISKEDLIEGLDEATCPSCSLVVKVIYNKVSKIHMKSIHFSHEIIVNFQEMFKTEIDIEKKLENLSITETKVCN